MPIANPSLNWELLDTVFYRSRTCYDTINWNINNTDSDEATTEFSLDKYNVSIGPYASIIALYPKTLSHLKISEKILIYSPAGVELFSLIWNFTLNPVVKIGWTSNGELIIVLLSGKYRIYYNYEGDFEEFDIFNTLFFDETSSDDQNMKELTIVDAVFTKVGFAIQTSNNHFIYIQNPKKLSKITCIKCSQLATIDPIEPYHITSWTITSPPDYSLKSLGIVTFYIFTSAGLCILNSTTSKTTTPMFSHDSLLTHISYVSIAPNNNFAALYSSKHSRLYILDGKFEDLLVQHDLEKAPLDISWCSNDVVVVAYQDYISVVGPTSDSLNFYTNGRSYIKGEIDGLYYLTTDELNFLSRVSTVTEETFKIGSTAPSAILVDAIDYLDRHSPKANEHLEIIDNNLVMAVDGCIRAASEEFDLYWQKNLLRAAAFGKVNLDFYDPTEYVQTCDYLRVLNIIRGPEIGIFMTFSQLHNIGIEKLIDFLLLRHMHYLCLKISKFLNLPDYKILTDWASCKIKYSSGIKDDELLTLIYNKLKASKIDWSHIAYVAYTEGREVLARNLLTYEPNTSKKVQFLLELTGDSRDDEIEYALIKADEDGDVDSLVLILLQLYSSLSNVEFFKSIDDKPNAIGILKNIACQCDETGELLRNYLFQDDDVIGMLVYDFMSILKSKDLDPKDLNKLQSLASRSKEIQYILSHIKSKIKLLKLQQDELQPQFHAIIPGEPLLDSIQKILITDLKQAMNVGRKFSVPPKQLAYTILKTLASRSEKHAELYDYATINGGGKLIGFEAFYYELFRLGERRQAGLYLSHCKNMNSKQKIRSFVCCGMWKEAVAQAGSNGEIEILRSMRDSRTGWESKLAADEIEKLGKK